MRCRRTATFATSETQQFCDTAPNGSSRPKPIVRSLLALAQLLPIVQPTKWPTVIVVEGIVMVASDRLRHRGARAAVLVLFIFVLPPLLWTLLIWTDKLPPKGAGLAGGIATLAVAMYRASPRYGSYGCV